MNAAIDILRCVAWPIASVLCVWLATRKGVR